MQKPESMPGFTCLSPGRSFSLIQLYYRSGWNLRYKRGSLIPEDNWEINQ